MIRNLTLHYHNFSNFDQPVAYVRVDEGEPQTVQPAGQDDFGSIFKIEASKNVVLVKFGDANNADHAEPDEMWRKIGFGRKRSAEVWCRSWNPFVYTSAPALPDGESAVEVAARQDFTPGQYISESGERVALGANPLRDGGVFFGFFHPHAARVYLTGTFNNWAVPGNGGDVIEMKLHRGFFDLPNVWLATVDAAKVGDEYQFYIVHDSLAGDGNKLENLQVTDPYARVFGKDYEHNNALVVDASGFQWEDGGFKTPDMHDLIIYQLHVYGFTHEHADVVPEHQGTYQGVIDRIHAGYFEQLGANALYLMPLAEAPTPQGEHSLGYNTSVFTTVERDFGTPDDLRRLVNEAHKANLAVIADEVFNHTANEFNPLWKLILDHPDEWGRGEEGGLYFSGQSPWGNRTATERLETQNMLIDTCKLLLVEYHIDGFRFDYTHSSTMHHGFLNRLADELQALKPDVILIAENMPNEADLNRQGYNGFAQWHDHFHDSIKALLREGTFEGIDDRPEILGEVFYFSKGTFAAHTNNVVNYCESHDEHSVTYEIGTTGNPNLSTSAAKERKGRLGLGASLLALGQPMLYMGQEFAAERERNTVFYKRPEKLEESGFFQWTAGMAGLRRRYPALKLFGYDPIGEGEFEWIAGPWLDGAHGGGQRVIGWRSKPNANKFDCMVILFNFENHPVEINLELGSAGVWVRLADIDAVTDIAPRGENSAASPNALQATEAVFPKFTLPDSSLFVYKWEAEIGG